MLFVSMLMESPKMKRIRYGDCVFCFEPLSDEQYDYCSPECEDNDHRAKRKIKDCCKEPGCCTVAKNTDLCLECRQKHVDWANQTRGIKQTIEKHEDPHRYKRRLVRKRREVNYRLRN